MPQERESQFPMVTAAEVEAAPGDPATKAARNLMVRNIPGIPRRAYLIGSNDHAPIVQGLAEFTGRVIELIAQIDHANLDLKLELPGDLVDAAAEVAAMMEEHGCLE